jgi:hypothetical protein
VAWLGTVPWNPVTGTLFLMLVTGWGGLLLLPMLVVGFRIVRKGPPAARWLLIEPVPWIVSLLLMTYVTVPHATAPQLDRAFTAWCVSMAASLAVGPAYAFARGLKSSWVIAWLALNLLVSASVLPVLGLIGFDT